MEKKNLNVCLVKQIIIIFQEDVIHKVLNALMVVMQMILLKNVNHVMKLV